MRLVQTSVRGENSMNVESFSLLESGSTMPNRGIALPPLTWYFCIDWCRAAAFSIYQRRMNHHSILVQPQSLLFLSINFSLPSYAHRTWWLLWFIVVSDPPISPPIPSHQFYLNPPVLVCPLLRFDSFRPLGIFIHRRFLTIPRPLSHDSESVGGGRREGSAMKQKKWHECDCEAAIAMRWLENKLENDRWINFPYLVVVRRRHCLSCSSSPSPSLFVFLRLGVPNIRVVFNLACRHCCRSRCRGAS